MTEALLDSPVVQSIGWALIHFVWQGTLIGVATALTLRALAGARPAMRYAVACCSLAVMLVVPVVAVLTARASGSLPLAPAAAAAVNVVPPVPVDGLLPFTVAAWLAGVLLLSFRLIVACAVVERLKRATRSVDATVVARVQSLAHRFGVDRPVRVFESTLVRVPTVIGYLRPVILLPASVITGLAPAYLDAVLAHELAHVRRHDYLVNALQSLVETLLFYHPAVWWCSRQIRIEREHCCDDMVVEAGGNRLAYATALAQLEELRGLEPMLSLNASGGRLVDRIRRLLAESPMKERRSTMWTIAAALAVVTALVVTPARTVADASEFMVSPQSDSRRVNSGWADYVRETQASLETLARETQGVAVFTEPREPELQAQPAPPLPAVPRMPGAVVVPPTPPLPPNPPLSAQPAQAASPAAPAPPSPPAPPVPPGTAAPTQAAPSAPPAPPGAAVLPPLPDLPRPPDPPPVPDVSEIVEELNRARAELMKGFDEMRRAAADIVKHQLQVQEMQAAVEKMKGDMLAKSADLEAIRKSMAELMAKRAALGAQPEVAEMRKQIDAIRQEMEKQRAK